MTPRSAQRTRPGAPALVSAFILLVGLAGCGDDANDRALQAARLADRLAAERATTTVPDTTGAGSSVAPGPTGSTVPVVEPTGVVIPVVALDNSFRPVSIEAAVGDEVVWENRGRNEHDVLSVEGTLDDGTAWGITVDDFQPGAIYSHVFTEPGEYRYYCTIHGTAEVGMVGTVVVTG